MDGIYDKHALVFMKDGGKHVNTTIILELDKYLYPGSNIYFLAQFVL